MKALEVIGANARPLLLIGCLLAMAFPAAASGLRPLLPGFVAMVYAVSLMRIDLREFASDMVSPRLAAQTFGLSALMLTLTPALGWLAIRAVGLDAGYQGAAVYALAAPPIASAATICFLLGLNAALALRLTIGASLLAPFLGPLTASALLGAAVPISALDLTLRIAAMIAAGAAAAVILRQVLGPARIARRAKALDGVGALALLIFVVPLMDGLPQSATAAPLRALGFLALSALLIFGPHWVMRRSRFPQSETGAAATVWGTRSVAIYAAALPPDPEFLMFVALYQLPMLATPIVMARLYGR